jgi:ribosomal protein S18 acetylase RimI-like enzyme
MAELRIRGAEPADFDRIIAEMDDWWGRPVSSGLVRLFLDHFYGTSFVVDAGGREDTGGGRAASQTGTDPELAGFLVGFWSQSRPAEAYIHYMGVAPGFRRAGLARKMYEEFFALSRAGGRTMVRAITSPENETSIAFHTAMGFTVTGPVPGYDGPGKDRVLFERGLP